jgi:hypothetical protein
MHNPKLTQVANRFNQLLEQSTRFFLFQLPATCDIAEELTVTTVFHDDKQIGGSLYDFVHLDDVWVTNKLQNVEFTGDSFDICYFSDLALVEDLYCNLLFGEKMDSFLYFPERSLAQSFSQKVASDHKRLLVRFKMFLWQWWKYWQ